MESGKRQRRNARRRQSRRQKGSNLRKSQKMRRAFNLFFENGLFNVFDGNCLTRQVVMSQNCDVLLFWLDTFLIRKWDTRKNSFLKRQKSILKKITLTLHGNFLKNFFQNFVLKWQLTLPIHFLFYLNGPSPATFSFSFGLFPTNMSIVTTN